MALNFIEFSFPAVANVRCAFQTRSGDLRSPFDGGNVSLDLQRDVAQTRKNRAEMLSRLSGRGLARLAELRQVHGDAMVFEPADAETDLPPQTDGDGMATACPGKGLLIKTADCQPILIADCRGRAVAAVHAGWRGSRCAFPQTAVARFCERYGLSPEELVAVRGPSLGPAKAEFVNFESEWGDEFAEWFDPRTRTMDLWSLTRRQLRAAGIPERQIFGIDLCTFSNGNFFSHRRDRNSGRQGSLIWIDASGGAGRARQ
ncbi:MAG: laccase domain-containing protein [Desulfovibrio sp.]|nr:laccase domain-containing protein [Desulfovibrio sp.]